MCELKIGDSVFVQSYKHNGSIHRTWSKAFVIDVLDDCYVVVTDHSWVVEADRRRWLTKEPAICFYYRNRWFNIISMVRKNGIYYYCNVATPSIYDGEAIKNVDYDLDVKVFPDGTYMVLDENEFEYHCQKMNYSSDIRKICIDAKNELVEMVEKKQIPFDFSYINTYIMKYFELVFEKKDEEKADK
ncbi:MAG: DUF402 domain-containing protein [Erysipelotrichaceae bacterium]|nr:DUF402 domain-containing protein [Erysipelotrichaceae bacterium]